MPFTRVAENTGFIAGSAFTAGAIGTLNSARLPWTSQLDLRLDKPVALAGTTVEAFVWIENLLGADNVLAVYRSTGLPDDDGYLATSGGQVVFATPESEALYRAYTSGAVNVGGRQSTANPFVYGQPRQVRLGLRASF